MAATLCIDHTCMHVADVLNSDPPPPPLSDAPTHVSLTFDQPRHGPPLLAWQVAYALTELPPLGLIKSWAR